LYFVTTGVAKNYSKKYQGKEECSKRISLKIAFDKYTMENVQHSGVNQ